MSRTWHHGDKAKQRKFGDNWRWYQSTPSWWVRICMSKPHRAGTRRLLAETHRLVDYEDAAEFPLARKPHEYYW